MGQSSIRKRASIAILASLVAMAALASCAGQKNPAEPLRVQGKRFSLRLVPGPEYKATSWWLIFPIPIYPQVACWIETPRGEYIDTLYVTAKGAKKTWVSAPAGGRPEALPVWSSLMSKQKASADTVSGATPSGVTTSDSPLAATLPNGKYIVKLEVNRSYDYNERYTRANSGVTGQPSLIYECAIDLGSGPSKAAFTPIGTGSVDGSDGDIRQGLEGITSALKLLESADISYVERTTE